MINGNILFICIYYKIFTTFSRVWGLEWKILYFLFQLPFIMALAKFPCGCLKFVSIEYS